LFVFEHISLSGDKSFWDISFHGFYQSTKSIVQMLT